MKKRIMALLIVLCLVCGMVPAVSAATLDNGLEYEVYVDHVEITRYTGTATEVVIPAEIEGLPVTSIGNEAFYGRFNLKIISLPLGLKSIGTYAFGSCENLTSINIPNSVTSIGSSAFSSCSKLTSISIPSSTTFIGYGAFMFCSAMTNIQVDSDNDTYASQNGILYTKDLATLICCPGGKEGAVKIPDRVTTVRNSAFKSCDRLTNISVPNSVTSIGDEAFSMCESLIDIQVDANNDAYASMNGILYSKDMATLICCPCGQKGSVHIPNSVTSIEDYAFYCCTKLTDVTFPNSLASIGDDAFSHCQDLNSIRFMGNVPEIDNFTFYLVNITAYYPADNATWTEDVMQNYGGTITWVPYNPGNPFTDVPVDSFYEAPVLWALENGITTGASETSFNPNGQCLRAQVVTFLHRAAENPQPVSTVNPFTDVKPTDFFYKPVLWAVEEGITNGVSATEFGSYAVCNRAAVVTFLWRAAGSPAPTSTANPFTDVKTTDFFYKPVLWAIENGITNGVSATEFGPTADCNRAQVVTFLYRAYN